jgi:hypothetical protein
MARSVYITLTSAGVDTGPFNLYSNADGFVTPFESNVSKASLVGGYLSLYVPNAATIIQIRSMGACQNYINLSGFGYVAPSVSPTPSVTVTPTKTPSVTPSVTITPSVTKTPSVSITPSVTKTPSVTPSVTPSPGLSPTPTPTVTPSVTPSVTITPSISKTPSVTPSPSVINTSTLTISFVGPYYGGPVFNASLTSALPSTIRFQNMVAVGYNTTACSVGTDVDSFQLDLGSNPFSLIAGNTFGSGAGGYESGNAFRYLVRSQQIGLIGAGTFNQISMDPGTGTFVTVSNGGTINVGGVLVTVVIQSCAQVLQW